MTKHELLDALLLHFFPGQAYLDIPGQLAAREFVGRCTATHLDTDDEVSELDAIRLLRIQRACLNYNASSNRAA